MEILNLRDKDYIITLQWLDESIHQAKINWLQQLEEGKDYYLAGLTYLAEGKLLHGDECDEWVLRLNPEEGFIPMFCTLQKEVSE